MFPYRDDNPTLRTPVVTWLLIAANVAVWVLVEGMGTDPALAKSVCELALIPAEFLGRVGPGTVVRIGPDASCALGEAVTWYTPLTSMFLHGGWLHLIGNMWFLHVFGNNVEDSMGHGRYLAFYILCGLVAAATQTLVHPASTIPMLGASGAIGGVMGAYVILYPLVRVHMFIFLGLFFFRYAVPAYFMLGYWFLLQVLSGLPALSQGGDMGGTAFWAHIGGFAAGMLFVFFFQNPTLVAQHRAVLAAHPQYGRIR